MPGRDFASKPYKIRRMEISLTAAELYVRTFWWMLIGLPISGVLILAFIHEPVAKVLALVMLFWPATIPARAGILTYGAAKRYANALEMAVTDDGIFVRPTGGKNARIPWSWVRQVQRRGDLLIFLGPRAQFLLARTTAFEDADFAGLEQRLKEAGLLRGRSPSTGQAYRNRSS